MPDRFLGRELTDLEQKLRADHRCIACGTPVEKRPGGVYPYECSDCWQVRTRTIYRDEIYTKPRRHQHRRPLRPRPTSLHHDVLKSLGYPACAGSGPEMRDDGDD
jgi:ribosomal protein L37AE/L43A